MAPLDRKIQSRAVPDMGENMGENMGESMGESMGEIGGGAGLAPSPAFFLDVGRQGGAILPRRRFLGILALAGGALVSRGAQGAAPQPFSWTGTGFGGDIAITLYGPASEKEAITRIFNLCAARLEHLQSIFSLYDPGSALCRLNCQGVLKAPPADLVALLKTAQEISARTGGAFDITVQPLWALFATHFASPTADPRGPDPAAIAFRRALVDYRKVDISPSRIAFRHPGMAITLNGIAQGYATDVIADLLREQGFSSVLVNLGEFHATGPKPGGLPWRIGLLDPMDRSRLSARLPLYQGAIATSAPYGLRFDPEGRFHHLLDPATGTPTQHVQSVTVTARRAVLADGLSTAFASMSPHKIAKITGDIGISTRLTHKTGTVLTF